MSQGAKEGGGGGGSGCQGEHFDHPIGTTGDPKDPMGSKGIVRGSKDFEGGPSGVQAGQKGRPGSLMGSRIRLMGFLMIHKVYI